MGSINDRWYAYLVAQTGASGQSVDDMARTYWNGLAGGPKGSTSDARRAYLLTQVGTPSNTTDELERLWWLSRWPSGTAGLSWSDIKYGALGYLGYT